MGKAAERRKRNREQYLTELAQTNPKKFREQWAKRLESWILLAWKRAGRLTDREGRPTPPVIGILDRALEELRACGERAVKLEEASTRETLGDGCTHALAASINPAMYPMPSSPDSRERAVVPDWVRHALSRDSVRMEVRR